MAQSRKSDDTAERLIVTAFSIVVTLLVVVVMYSKLTHQVPVPVTVARQQPAARP